LPVRAAACVACASATGRHRRHHRGAAAPEAGGDWSGACGPEADATESDGSSDSSDSTRGSVCRAESPTPGRVGRRAPAAEAAGRDVSDRGARASDAGPDGDDDGGVGPADGDDAGAMLGSVVRDDPGLPKRMLVSLGAEASGRAIAEQLCGLRPLVRRLLRISRVPASVVNTRCIFGNVPAYQTRVGPARSYSRTPAVPEADDFQARIAAARHAQPAVIEDVLTRVYARGEHGGDAGGCLTEDDVRDFESAVESLSGTHPAYMEHGLAVARLRAYIRSESARISDQGRELLVSLQRPAAGGADFDAAAPVGPDDLPGGSHDGGNGPPDRHWGPSATRAGAPVGLEAAGLRPASRTRRGAQCTQRGEGARLADRCSSGLQPRDVGALGDAGAPAVPAGPRPCPEGRLGVRPPALPVPGSFWPGSGRGEAGQ